MGNLNDHLIRLYVAIASPRRRDERGDVPGWVLVVLMSVGLVVVIGALAEDQLTGMLRSAFNKVK